MNDWQDHISINPKVCHGWACIRGTRIPVPVVLDKVAADGIRAALSCAAELAQVRHALLPGPEGPVY